MKRSQILRIVLGGVAIKQYPQIVWGRGGVPYTNQHPTLIELDINIYITEFAYIEYGIGNLTIFRAFQELRKKPHT